MSYTLARPMFRLGGQSADGVGITSGFNRRRYEGGAYGDEIREKVTQITEKPKFGTDELIAEAYRTVGGASGWEDWIKQGSDRALEIQEEEKVAVVPGTAFGKSGEGFIRSCYATKLEGLKEALIRIERFCEKHRK